MSPSVSPSPEYCFLNDFFIGDDFDPLDPTLWYTKQYQHVETIILNNEARFTSIDDGDYCWIQANYYFTDTFDIVLDWNIYSMVTDPNASLLSGFQFGFQDRDETYAYHIAWRQKKNGDNEVVAIGELGEDIWADPSSSGTFRIIREADGEVYAFMWNESASRWEWNGDTNGSKLMNADPTLDHVATFMIHVTGSGPGDVSEVDAAFSNYRCWDGCDNLATSFSASISASLSPSLSPSVSPSVSPSASISASISPSISPSLSPSASISPSPSPSIPAEGELNAIFSILSPGSDFNLGRPGCIFSIRQPGADFEV